MTLEQLRSRVAESIGVESRAITDDARQEDIAEWDSLAAVNIIALLDEQIDGDLDSEDVEKLTSFPAIVAFARSKGLLEA